MHDGNPATEEPILMGLESHLLVPRQSLGTSDIASSYAAVGEGVAEDDFGDQRLHAVVVFGE